MLVPTFRATRVTTRSIFSSPSSSLLSPCRALTSSSSTNASTQTLLQTLLEPTPTKKPPYVTREHYNYSERQYHLHVQATRNNTILTFTDSKGSPIAWVSGGSVGFKKVQRSGYEAGYQCALKIFQRIAEEKKKGSMSLEILFKGFGQGREAVYRALMTNEGADVRSVVKRLTDTTPIKIGGTRAKKRRVL